MMERALKERIIGAAVLVLFVVLVVPIFLDGPPDATEIVSEPVLLPGQQEQKTQTVVLERNRTEPVPVVSSSSESAAPAAEKAAAPKSAEPEAASPKPQKAEEKPAVVAKKTAPTPKVVAPKPQPPAKTPTASTTGMWAVQLGSFSNKDNAEKLAADLRKQGYAAFLSQLATDSGRLHRVRIGPQKDRESAEAMASRLLKVGHDGQVVPHP
jgi:DedD protein